MKKILTIALCFLGLTFLRAQSVQTTTEFGSNAVINMRPNPSGGNNEINMFPTEGFGRSALRLIYEKNELTPPAGPLEFAWEVGHGGLGVNDDFFSIGQYIFNLDFILQQTALVINNQTLFTGIGETTPDARLHVFNLDDLNDGANRPAAVIGEYPGPVFGYGYLTVDQPTDDLNANIARFRDNGSTQVQINRGSSTYQLQVFGDAFANGTWNTSDRRLKTNLQPLRTAMNDLRRLKAYSYSFKRDRPELKYLPKEQQFGLIAQDLQEVFPNLVRESEALNEGDTEATKTLAVNYIGLIPVLIAAVQEADQELADKTRELEILRAENESQQQQIDELRAMMEKILANQSDTGETGSSYTLSLTKEASLSQNFPNPFDQNTRIEYFIPDHVQDAKIQVTATDGKVLGIINIAETGPGQLTIKAGTYPAGTYFYSLIVDGELQETKRMVLTR